MVLLCYPKCSTCKATQKELDQKGIVYEYRDIKLNNPSLEELTLWKNENDIPLKRYFNSSGLIYKSLELKNKLSEMTEEEQLQLLSTDGMLVKRPLLIEGNQITIGKKNILEKYSN